MNDATPTPSAKSATAAVRDAAEHELPASTRPFVDYSSQMRIHRNPALRVLLRVLGVLFLGLGTLGYMLPGLPGTVFILIAAYFFAQSSPRFYNWLMNHRQFGKWVRDFRAGKGVPLWLKFYVPAVIVVSSALSIYYLGFVRGVVWAAVLTAAVAFYGVYYILKLPTRPPEKRD